jgi:ketosteroid isomerase-like protein
MSTTDEILAAAAARSGALAAADAEALHALHHPDLRWTSFRGDVFDRETYVRRNAGGPVRFRSQVLEEPEVVAAGEAAVLVAVVVDEVEQDGRVERFRLRLTQTWVRHEDRWVVLAAHAGPRLDAS